LVANVCINMAKILVTGGCGYIGSHTIVSLIESGHQVISIDSLYNSYEKVLDGIHQITSVNVENLQIDLRDAQATAEALQPHHDVDAIIHFAALKAVGESVAKPLLYFDNNLKSLLHILDFAQAAQVKHLVFSSSCTVYGIPDQLPVTEATPLQPASSPYGRTKQLCEEILRDISINTELDTLSLRYFNPAGAHTSGAIGEESRNPALNLVPVITQTAAGKRNQCAVYGNDYDTRDGSCIRDYIHVMDLADAHVKAINFMIEEKMTDSFDVYNLGIGDGVSVLEAIQAFEKVSGTKLNYKIGPRREGDVPAIYANLDKAREDLGWEPKYDVEDIMRTAWEWEKKISD